MSIGCGELQKYIRSSHKIFYGVLDDDCVTGLLGARKAEYPRGAVIPSKEGYAALKKLTSPEKRLEFLKAYCLVTAWTPDELKLAGRYLVTRNHKRLPVKSASGKKVELDNGVVLELAHSSIKHSKIVVYKVTKGLLVEGAASERADLGISSKKGGGLSNKKHSRSIILNGVRNAVIGQAIGTSSSAGIRELVALVMYASSKSDKGLAGRVASTFGYMPIIESFIVFGSREVVDDASVAGFIDFYEKEFNMSYPDIIKTYLELADKGSKDLCLKRRNIVINICKKDALQDPGKLISLMRKMYDHLDSSNTIGDVTAFKDAAASMHKKHRGWKMWSDDFRFRWWTVLNAISNEPAGETTNIEYSEALVCMQQELMKKRCRLLNMSTMARKEIVATRMMLSSDIFLFVPLSVSTVSACKTIPLEDAPEKLSFTSALSTAAAHFNADTMTRGGGMGDAKSRYEEILSSI